MKRTLNRISKIISSAIFVILMIIIALIVVYIVRVKVLTNSNRLGEIKTNFYTILTQSMYPTIEAGDIVITYKNDNNLYGIGDIITFMPQGSSITITHKVVDVSNINGQYYYQTKGDNNASADTSLTAGSAVVGRVVFRIPKAGYIQQFLVSKVGWIVAIVLPCLGIVIYDILKVVKLAYGKGKNKVNNSKKSLAAKEKLKQVIKDET